MKIKFTRILSSLLFSITFAGTAVAQCTISGLSSNYCTNSNSSTLTPGIPGGNFSGPGISGNVFNPAIAGPGTHSISYVSGCSIYSLSSAPYATLTTAGTAVTLGDDQVSAGLPIGFNFVFFCNSYNTFYISSNGFITFSNNSLNGCCSGLSMPTNSTTDPNNLIAYAWTDLYPPANGSITYTTIGASPNRTLIVSFNAIYHYNSATYCCPITSQIQLTETTNRVEIHTTSKPLPTNTYITTMGILNVGGTIAYPVTGRNATSTWTATNECYRWMPAPACNLTQTTIVSPSTINVVGTTSICSGAQATLTASGNTTYTWNTGSNSASIVVSPSINTTYAVLATNAFNCAASSAITVTVNITPTVSAISTAPGGGACPGSTVALSGQGATSYTWTGGIQNGVPFPVGAQSSYTVSGTNACGTSSATIGMSIHPLPTVNGVASQPSVCSTNSVNLTGIGNAVSYAWSNGVPNGTNFFPTATANYTVIGSSALGCTASAVTGVTVVTTPLNPPVATPPLICVGSTATLSSSGATTYTWITPSGTQSNSVITVSPTGNTTYTLTKSNANCVNSQTIQLFVNQLPSLFAISSPTIICASTTATLNVGGAQTYTWSAPSFSVTGSSPIVSPSVTTLYTVAASDGTCANTTTVLLATNPNPTISIAATSSNICQGDAVNLSASGALGYSWTAGATSNTNSASINESPILSTLYQVSGNNSFNCTGSAQMVVVVRVTPTLTAASTKTLVCTGAASGLTVTAQGGASTYTWSANAGSATSATATVNPLTTTIYTVLGMAANNCTAAASIPISVFLPSFAVNSPTSSCLGGTINLIASGANTYTWNGNQPFSQISVSPSGPTLYIVAATSNSSNVNCVSTNTVFVTIYNNPTITAVPSRTQICRGEFTNINAGGALSYTLNTGLSGSVIPVNPNVNTTYTLTGTDLNGCVSSSTVLVRISTCFGIGENSRNVAAVLVYPNPNTGSFTIRGLTNVDLKLFDELGRVVQTIRLAEANQYEITLRELAAGLYFLSDSNGLYEKIVVTK